MIVLQVRKGSAADRAGLQGIGRSGRRFVLGDVVLAVNGKPTPNVDRFLDLLEAEAMGSTVQLEVMRQGQKRKVPLRVEAVGAP